MGTSYAIVLPTLPPTHTAEQIQRATSALLAEVNAVMSTYQADSELSRLNRNASLDWIPVSPALLTVLAESQRISALSKGAFDVTVGPLVNVWGFGPENLPPVVPEAAAIAAVRDSVGYDKLQLQMTPPAVKKAHPKLTVDLSAIAKGYGVDQIAAYLDQLGIANYLVDIGGELRTRGYNAQGQAWKIAIEKPIADGRAVQQVIPVSNAGVATSGDYRNYFEHEGQRYSHTIDPTTGAPIVHALVSVTVIQPTAMTADGLATALLVLGPERALALAEQEAWPVYLLVKTAQGFKAQSSSAFQPFLSPIR
jgi:thiamine biosynthesis lipoprotein